MSVADIPLENMKEGTATSLRMQALNHRKPYSSPLIDTNEVKHLLPIRSTERNLLQDSIGNFFS